MSSRTTDFDEVMDNALVAFAKDLLKQGKHNKQEVAQWIKDRFDTHGSLRVLKYDTGLTMHDDAGSNVFSFRPYQVYNINAIGDTVLGQIKIKSMLGGMSTMESYALSASMVPLTGRKSLIVWKLYRPLSTSDMVAVYGMATNAATTAGYTETMVSGVPVTILCHHMEMLLEMGVLDYYGHQCNDAHDAQRMSGSN
tara:strand:+ start:100 stop:687 length:588 start_codon:yes stop_codon:yes gene_type:complete